MEHSNILIKAINLSKQYGQLSALSNLNFTIEKGKIIGLIGPNGAGKSTLLRAITGLHDYLGELNVLGFSAKNNRTKILKNISFIPDTTILPGWIRIGQLFELMQAIYPTFNSKQAKRFLADLDLTIEQKVKTCSKGMIARLHLALMIALNTQLLILDEPTLSLDPLAREKFYRLILDDYYTPDKTVLISSHQVDEIAPLLTHVMFIKEGKITLFEDITELSHHYFIIEAKINSKQYENLSRLPYLYQFKGMHTHRFLFDNRKHPKNTFDLYGALQTPTLNDLFKALSIGEQQ